VHAGQRFLTKTTTKSFIFFREFHSSAETTPQKRASSDVQEVTEAAKKKAKTGGSTRIITKSIRIAITRRTGEKQ